MNKLKNILMAFVGLFFLLLTLFYLFNFFGVTEVRYKCTVHDGYAFLKIETYNPLIFWSNDQGSVWVEIPTKTSEFYSKVFSAGDYIFFSTNNIDNNLHGTFSSLSNWIVVETDIGNFEGECKSIP